jgi:hypothetical protein
MLTVAELADYALTRPEDILEYEEGRGQPVPSTGARALATFGLTPGQLAGRYPPDAVAEVASWSRRDPDTPRYHQLPNSRLRFVVWRILPPGAVPPGVAHDRDFTDDNPLNGEPGDLLLTAEPGDDVTALVDTIAERHHEPHAAHGHWILRLPVAGRLYPFSCQGITPIRDHTKVVAPPVDTDAHLNDLVGPGQAMLLNLDTGGHQNVLRCPSAWHEMTGNPPADANP